MTSNLKAQERRHHGQRRRHAVVTEARNIVNQLDVVGKRKRKLVTSAAKGEGGGQIYNVCPQRVGEGVVVIVAVIVTVTVVCCVVHVCMYMHRCVLHGHVHVQVQVQVHVWAL